MYYVEESIKEITTTDHKVFCNVYISPNQRTYQECIDTLSTYECSIIADDKTVLTILVLASCCHKPSEEVSAVKGSFVMQGKRKVLMCQERNYTF